MVALLTEKYTLESVIVSTRTADLYRVTVPGSSQAANLWLLRHTILPGSPAESRFLGRMEKICNLRLPGVSIQEYGVDQSGAAYVVLVQIGGIKLSYTPRKIAQVERLIEGIIERVVVLHDAGLVCGDLSPSSFFLDKSGDVIWIGVIGSFEVEAQSTAVAPPIATYHYLAPEQRTGAGLSQASDVYSLGVMSYFLFSGQFPIGDSKRILLGPPDPATIIPIETLQPTTPPWAQVIIPMCLTLSASQRPGNARQLLEMIHSYRQTSTLGLSSDEREVDPQDSELVRFGERAGGIIERDQNTSVNVKEFGSTIKTDDANAHYSARSADKGESSRPLTAGIIEKFFQGGIRSLVMLVGVVALITVIGIVSLRGGKRIGVRPLPPTLNLANTGDESRVEAVISGLNEKATDNEYRNAVVLATELHIKEAKSLPRVESSIVRAISKVYGNEISTRISAVLADKSLDSCYKSLLTLFSPSVAVDDRRTLVNDCLSINPIATVQLVSLIAIQTGSSEDWNERLRASAHDVLGINTEDGTAVTALILARDVLRSLQTPEKQGQMIRELSSKDLLWLFGSLSGEQGPIFSTISREVVRRAAITPPRSEFLKPFVDQESISPSFRDGLIRAISGKIDGETIGLAGHWLNRSSSNILLALCAEAEEDQVRLKAFDTLAARKITQEPAASWVNYLKGSPALWSRRGEYAKLVCDSYFFEALDKERKRNVIDTIGQHVNENAFLEALLGGGSVNMLREATSLYGKDFSPNYLVDLLRAQDKETRIAALKNLKSYNDLYLLRNVVEAFKREKDLDVKAIYRENYWVVRQYEEKNAGHDLARGVVAPTR